MAERESLFRLAYRDRYGYPWRWAILATVAWRIEHLPFSFDGQILAPLARAGYRWRKHFERKGAGEPNRGQMSALRYDQARRHGLGHKEATRVAASTDPFRCWCGSDTPCENGAQRFVGCPVGQSVAARSNMRGARNV